jgi:hypothetical protein
MSGAGHHNDARSALPPLQYAIIENTVNELKIFDAIHHSRSGIYRQPHRRTFG